MRWMTRAIARGRAALQAAPDVVLPRSRSLVQLALPAICAGCEKDLEEKETVPLCPVCRNLFSMASESVCTRCAAPAPAATIQATGCPYCRDSSFRFRQATALGIYQGELRSYVLRMKHQPGELLSLAAGQLLGEHIQRLNWTELPDLVTAAPMHWIKRVWRNINAPAVIAESTAKVLRRPLLLDVLRAVKMVARQSSLTAAKRQRNVRGAYGVSKAYDIRDAHVLVIDDVMTTGSTANELTRPLLKAGAKTVSIAVVARSVFVD